MDQTEPEGDGFGRGSVPPQSSRDGDHPVLNDAVTAGADNIVKTSAALRQRFEWLWDASTPVSASAGIPGAFRGSPWLN